MPAVSSAATSSEDKLFYFGSYEGDYNRAAVSGLLSMPNATLLSGNFSGSPNPIYDPATGDLTTGRGRTPFCRQHCAWRSRSRPGCEVASASSPRYRNPNATQLNNFVSQGQVYNLHKIDTKVDYTVNSKLRISGRYGYQPYYNLQQPVLWSVSWVAQLDSRRRGAGNYLQHGATLAHLRSGDLYRESLDVRDRRDVGVTQGHQLLFPDWLRPTPRPAIGHSGSNTGPLPWRRLAELCHCQLHHSRITSIRLLNIKTQFSNGPGTVRRRWVLTRFDSGWTYYVSTESHRSQADCFHVLGKCHGSQWRTGRQSV